MNAIYQWFQEKCDQTPNATAIITEHKEYTYAEFFTDVETLAASLQSEQANSGVMAVLMERSYELLVTIWAILKMNGTYVPIDTAWNSERIRYVLEDSQTALIITDADNSENLQQVVGNKKVYIYNSNLKRKECPIHPIPAKIYSYIMYTSGSTGQPKGIQINQKALEGFLVNFRTILPANNFTKILALTSVSFDISLVELIYPLTLGKTVLIWEKLQAWNVKTILRIITQYQIDCLQTTPSLLNLLLLAEETGERLKSIRTLLVGGEVFSQTLLGKARELLDWEIYNLYGPTEATVWCMAANLSSATQSVIGHPFGDTTVFLLDEDRRIITEPNIPGELCIAGSQLAAGYVNQPALTSQHFIHDTAISRDKFYKTGDIAYYAPTGDIVYFGRKDNQVKISGRRIELEDVEESIKKAQFFQDAVVCVIDTDVTKYLRCYYVAEQAYDEREIKEVLTAHMPGYMIPKEYYHIEKIPLTSNGKKDRKALAKLDFPSTGS